MFRMPPITKNLLVINFLLYLASGILPKSGILLNDIFGLHFFMSDSFHFYQLITYMFMHANFEHVFFNMLALWMFGRIIEQVWGPKRFFIFYMVCGIGAGLCQELVQYIEYASEGLANYTMIGDGVTQMPMSAYLATWTTVGASGSIYGILLAFGMTFPNERIFLLIPPMPIKAKYLVIGYVVIELLLGFSASNSTVAHFAHLGGMLFGLLMILYWRHKSRRASYGFSSWSEYKPKKESAWHKFKSNMSSKSKETPRKTTETTKDPMAERRAKQDEIDRILDKVRKSGYTCLTEEEKKTIFDFRNKH